MLLDIEDREARHYEVFLNGEKVLGALEADDDAGYVIVMEQMPPLPGDPPSLFRVKRDAAGEILQKRLTGNVELRRRMS